MTSKRSSPEVAADSKIRPVPAEAPARKDPSRMMGLLIVDVLAARKVKAPASKKAAPAKKERA